MPLCRYAAMPLYQHTSSRRFALTKESTMDAASKSTLAIAFAVVAILLLIFARGMMTGTVMTGGMMGSGSLGGVSWMRVPTVLIVVLAFALVSNISGKKQLDQPEQPIPRQSIPAGRVDTSASLAVDQEQRRHHHRNEFGPVAQRYRQRVCSHRMRRCLALKTSYHRFQGSTIPTSNGLKLATFRVASLRP